MAVFMYYPATKLFYNIPPNTKNLKHDIQEILRHRFRSAYYAQSRLYRNLPSLKIRKKKRAC